MLTYAAFSHRARTRLAFGPLTELLSSLRNITGSGVDRGRRAGRQPIAFAASTRFRMRRRQRDTRTLTLIRFLQFIIRFGTVGAIHLVSNEMKQKAQFVFAPLARDGVYRDRIDDGQIIGHNTLLAVSIANCLSDLKLENECAAITQAVAR